MGDGYKRQLLVFVACVAVWLVCCFFLWLPLNYLYSGQMETGSLPLLTMIIAALSAVPFGCSTCMLFVVRGRILARDGMLTGFCSTCISVAMLACYLGRAETLIQADSLAYYALYASVGGGIGGFASLIVKKSWSGFGR